MISSLTGWCQYVVILIVDFSTGESRAMDTTRKGCVSFYYDETQYIYSKFDIKLSLRFESRVSIFAMVSYTHAYEYQ